LVDRRGLDDALSRVLRLEAEARAILAKHEATPERVVTLEQSYDKLDALSIDQDELFREALRATESGLFRAAHVLAWAGLIDFLHHYLWDNFQAELAVERPKWTVNAAEDLRDYTDHQVIETGKIVKAYSNPMMKALHGLLNTRNECAHPSDFYPALNDALGYLSSLLQRIKTLQSKVST
jgi:hypothetical protein